MQRWLVLLATGCGAAATSARPPAPPPPAAAPAPVSMVDCGAAAGRILEVGVHASWFAKPRPERRDFWRAHMASGLADLCRERDWSQAVVACVLSSTSDDSLDACESIGGEGWATAVKYRLEVLFGPFEAELSADAEREAALRSTGIASCDRLLRAVEQFIHDELVSIAAAKLRIVGTFTMSVPRRTLGQSLPRDGLRAAGTT